MCQLPTANLIIFMSAKQRDENATVMETDINAEELAEALSLKLGEHPAAT